MLAIDRDVIRGFLVAFVLAMALPPLLLLLVDLGASGHFSLNAMFLGLIAGAYPFSSATRFPLWLAILLTVIQMSILAYGFGRLTRLFSLGGQVFAALIGILLLSLAVGVAFALVGYEAPEQTSFPWG